MTNLIAIRDYLPTDEKYIIGSCMNGIYYGSDLFKRIKRSIFIKHYREFIQTVLKLPSVHVSVACLKNDTDEIKGYCILTGNKTTLFWVYIKPAWRRNGLCKSLVPSNITQFAHISIVGDYLIEHKCPYLQFNPFIT